MSSNIEGKTVVITGASSGLGEAAARHLSAQGASVVLGARRLERLQALADELTINGAKALAVTTDVTDRGQVTEDELIGAITHLAFYSGWPNAVTAIAVVREVFQEN